MEDKKLCKYCQERKKNGWCNAKKIFVPKKKKTEGLNIALTCEHFTKK